MTSILSNDSLQSAAQPPITSRMLVATDGRPQSDAALAMGRLLVKPHDSLRLATVVDPVNLVPESVMLFSVELETERREQLQRAVAEQTERVWGVRESAELLYGDVARSIASLARECDANLIIAGLGRHAFDDRVFGGETVLRMMRLADAPILAVADTMRHVPRRIVVGVDFSETSLQAAKFAIQLAAPGASITLVHVTPHNSDLFAWSDLHRLNATRALDALLNKIGPIDGKHLQTLLLHGDPPTEILATAAKMNADLVAIGTHGHGLIARFLIGSVATKIVRGSRCSVLVFPQAAAFQSGRDIREAVVARPILPEKWAALLDDITWQNMGRVVDLEIDDPTLGAQQQVSNRSFAGATFDHNDSRVSIMLGGRVANESHLTHSLGNVTAVDVLQDADGADVALRIKQNTCQTLVTFR